MKLLAYLKVALKGLIKEFPSFVLSYAIFPIILALVMGYVQKDMFTPAINDPIFSIIIVDEDNTGESKGLISFLSSGEMSKVLTIEPTDSDKFDYTLRIPEGYRNSLLGKNPASIKIEAKEKSSTTMGNILVNIIDKYNLEISQKLVIEKGFEGNSLSEENKESLMMEINHILNNIYSTNSIENNIYEVRKSLSSFEYYSITFLNFSFIVFLMAVIASDSLEKENGLYSRIMSTSMTRIQYFNYGFMSNYLTIIVANLIYVGAFRLSRLSFQGSLPILLLIVLVQSLMITIIGSLISTLFKKKYGIPILQVFLVVQMIFGGMIGPLDKWNSSPIFSFFAKFKPDAVIVNSYRNYIINNNLSSIYNYLFIMLGISMILYLVNLLLIQMKWGVNR
ncbi:ABC transporter permease [Tissierella pigra]|uniref:ABC transporter permease n=1 Tax=Tissierella pigra TaxID=2607614 RepID=A0A6N7XEL8_9FIRM|nr:ABC transporter permease [Tissierella pigra]MBU5425401.1 ABC transporter permease [Tissierella pigra]MSU00521.1 ABC transporter permease [Tissierella pigra]